MGVHRASIMVSRILLDKTRLHVVLFYPVNLTESTMGAPKRKSNVKKAYAHALKYGSCTIITLNQGRKRL